MLYEVITCFVASTPIASGDRSVSIAELRVGDQVWSRDVETGMYEYDGSFAYIDLKEAQHLLRMGDTVTGIEIWLDNPEEARDVAKDISAHLGEGYQSYNFV